MNLDTWVIVPMYQEQSVIRKVLMDLSSAFSNIVAVDDGSKDNTYAEAQKAGVAHIIRHPINLGAGAATQTGIDYALAQPNSKYFLTFDADGQHRVADAKKMVKFLKVNSMDIVLGTRFSLTTTIPISKKILLKTAIFSRNIFSGVKLTDTHIGLRAFNRKTASLMNLKLAGMSHASELEAKINRYKLKYSEVPVKVHYTKYSKSKGQPIMNSINILSDVVIMRLRK